MSRLWSSALIGLVFASPAPAAAQDAGGVFDMGQLTTTLATDHVTQSERARAGRRPSRATGKQAAACAQKGRFRSEYGANHPQVRRLYGLCRGVGL